MHGRCLCGAVVFEIAGNLPNLYQCHCSLCRKQSGAAANAATIVAVEQLTWISGREAIRSWTKKTGFRSDFCGTCGSPVPNLLRDKPLYWVPAGLLEDVHGSAVVVHFHVGSRAEWESRPFQGVLHDELPDLGQVLEELKKSPMG